MIAFFPLATRAQLQTGRIPVVGFLQASTPVDRYSNAFRQGMREYGYVDGQSVRIEDRWAGGRADRLPELISDLLTHGVDIFVAGGANAASAIRRAVDKPVVVVGFGDPMTSGLVVAAWTDRNQAAPSVSSGFQVKPIRRESALSAAKIAARRRIWLIQSRRRQAASPIRIARAARHFGNAWHWAPRRG